MAYDPFAPASGMMSTTSLPQAMPAPLPMPPTPAPLDPNNALAGVASTTSVPVATPGGGVTGAPLQPGQDFSGPPDWQAMWQQYQADPQAFMSSLPPQWAPMSVGGAGRFPGFAGMMPQGLVGYGQPRGTFDRAGYKGAMGDWRDMRPQFGGGQAAQGFRSDVSDWRSQRPSRSDFFAASTPTAPPASIAAGEQNPAASMSTVPVIPDALLPRGIGG